jgi:hypothetical protein
MELLAAVTLEDVDDEQPSSVRGTAKTRAAPTSREALFGMPDLPDSGIPYRVSLTVRLTWVDCHEQNAPQTDGGARGV